MTTLGSNIHATSLDAAGGQKRLKFFEFFFRFAALEAFGFVLKRINFPLFGREHGHKSLPFLGQNFQAALIQILPLIQVHIDNSDTNQLTRG
jgi:hypothetical protein